MLLFMKITGTHTQTPRGNTVTQSGWSNMKIGHIWRVGVNVWQHSKSSSRWSFQRVSRTIKVTDGPRPRIHASTFRHISGNTVKNTVRCIVFYRHFDDGLSRAVYIHCLKSSKKNPRPHFFFNPFVSISRSVYGQVTLSCLFSVEFRCRHRLMGCCALAWQRGHLARLSFLRNENAIVFSPSPLS